MKLSLAEVFAKSKTQNPQDILDLKLINRNISDAYIIAQLPNLKFLDVSNNMIQDLGFLQKLSLLETLIMNNNYVSSLEVFNLAIDKTSFVALRHVSLINNKIMNLEEIRNLQYLQLESLNLTRNGCCSLPNYFIYCMASIECLRVLDEMAVRDENGDIHDLDYFIDQIPITDTAKDQDIQIEPWLPPEAFEVLELPGFNQIIGELEQQLRLEIHAEDFADTAVDDQDMVD